MARNSLAGKGRTYKKRGMTARSIAKKRKYDAEYQKKRSSVKKRVQANRANRRAGTYGNGDNKDASHKRGGRMTMEAQSKNRARNGMKKGRKPSSKRRNTKKK
jgi:hypothetical protein